MSGESVTVLSPAPPAPAVAPARRTAKRRISAGDLVLLVGCVMVLGAAIVAVIPRVLNYQTYIVRTGSMEPTIRAGSVVVVEPVKPVSLKVGDIITYRRPEEPDRMVTHRIYQLRIPDNVPNPAPVIRTKGDANAVPDPWQIELRGTAWKEVFSIPLLGYVFDFAHGRWGTILFLFVPAIALSLYGIARVLRSIRTRAA